MSGPETPYIFISHSSDDNEAAREISTVLSHSGVNTWLDIIDIKQGHKWSRALENGLRNSFGVLVVMSESAYDSEWVEREILLALELRKQVYVAKIDDISVPLYLIDRQFSDLRRDKTKRLQRLAMNILGDMKQSVFSGESLERLQEEGRAQEVAELLQQQQSELEKSQRQEKLLFDTISNASVQHGVGSEARKLIYWAQTQFDKSEFSDTDNVSMQFQTLVHSEPVPVMTVWSTDVDAAVSIHTGAIFEHGTYADDTENRLKMLGELSDIYSHDVQVGGGDQSVDIPLEYLTVEHLVEPFQKFVQNIIVGLAGHGTFAAGAVMNDLLDQLNFDDEIDDMETQESYVTDDTSITANIPFHDENFDTTELKNVLDEKILVLVYGDVQWECRMNKFKREVIAGRRDPKTSYLPDIDLTEVLGAKKGVSRRHMSISFDPDDKLCYVQDLGSSNGTFVNGARIAPKEIRMVRSNDRIRLGGLLLTIYLE